MQIRPAEAIGRATADRRISVAWLGVAIICLTVVVIAEGILWHNAEVLTRDRRPQLVLLTPEGRAELVEFGAISHEAITGIVQEGLRKWVSGNFGCYPKTVTQDHLEAWAMLSGELRAQKTQEFKDETAKCASTPNDEIRIDHVIPTILSADPLKVGGSYRSLIAFEVIHVSDGRETRREVQTATAQFTIGGQPISNDSPDLKNANPLGISITAFREERES
jgi:hypothetical protein